MKISPRYWPTNEGAAVWLVRRIEEKVEMPEGECNSSTRSGETRTIAVIEALLSLFLSMSHRNSARMPVWSGASVCAGPGSIRLHS